MQAPLTVTMMPYKLNTLFSYEILVVLVKNIDIIATKTWIYTASSRQIFSPFQSFIDVKTFILSSSMLWCLLVTSAFVPNRKLNALLRLITSYKHIQMTLDTKNRRLIAPVFHISQVLQYIIFPCY